jgi:hypothetical protein
MESRRLFLKLEGLSWIDEMNNFFVSKILESLFYSNSKIVKFLIIK